MIRPLLAFLALLTLPMPAFAHAGNHTAMTANEFLNHWLGAPDHAVSLIVLALAAGLVGYVIFDWVKRS